MLTSLSQFFGVSLDGATRRTSLQRMVQSSTVMLLTVIGALIIGLALLILFHHNLNATKGYNLRALEFARNQLLLEQETLNMELAKAQSLDTLRDDKQIQAMQRPKKAQYIEVAPAQTVGVAQVRKVEQ